MQKPEFESCKPGFTALLQSPSKASNEYYSLPKPEETYCLQEKVWAGGIMAVGQWWLGIVLCLGGWVVLVVLGVVVMLARGLLSPPEVTFRASPEHPAHSGLHSVRPLPPAGLPSRKRVSGSVAVSKSEGQLAKKSQAAAFLENWARAATQSGKILRQHPTRRL